MRDTAGAPWPAGSLDLWIWRVWVHGHSLLGTTMRSGTSLLGPLSVMGVVLFTACTERAPTESQPVPRPLATKNLQPARDARAVAGRPLPRFDAIASVQAAGGTVGLVRVVDFEGFPDLTQITTQYSRLGVVFAGASILNAGGLLNAAFFPPRSGVGVVFDWPASFGGLITATFTVPVLRAGGYITGNRAITLRCFDSHGNLLGTASTPGPNFVGVGTPNLLLEISAPGIKQCTFTDGGNTYTVDDFTFTVDFAALIDAYLTQKSSPLAGTGAAFVASGFSSNVDPRLIVAIAGAESSFGRFLCAPFNAWNWFWGGTCAASPFTSWQEGIATVTKYMRLSYLNKGYTTIPLIGSKYCASGCQNWVPNVSLFYGELGGDPSNLGFPGS